MQTTSQTATAVANPNLAFLNVRDVNSIILTLRVGLDGMQSWGEQMSLSDVFFSQVVKIVADTQV